MARFIVYDVKFSRKGILFFLGLLLEYRKCERRKRKINNDGCGKDC